MEKEIMPIVDPHIGDTAIRDAEKRQQRDADLAVYQEAEERWVAEEKVIVAGFAAEREKWAKEEAEWLVRHISKWVDDKKSITLDMHIASLLVNGKERK